MYSAAYPAMSNVRGSPSNLIGITFYMNTDYNYLPRFSGFTTGWKAESFELLS